MFFNMPNEESRTLKNMGRPGCKASGSILLIVPLPSVTVEMFQMKSRPSCVAEEHRKALGPLGHYH